MQKAVLMMDYLNVTQGANNNFSHKGDCALDLGGKDSGRDDLRAPFDGTVKRIYPNCNAVWLQSNEKVKYADGTEDYMTLLTFHDNSVTSLYVGKKIKQGEVFYQEGTKGYATGNHIHLTVSKGKFTGSGWYQNEYGTWVANNQYSVHKALFLDSKTKILNDGGYKWVKTSDYEYNKPATKTIQVGSKVKIGLVKGAKKYIADDVQVKYGIYQIRENINAGGEKAFDWVDNGIPEACVDLTDKNGKKRADSDRVHAKKGDYFVFAKTFTVKKIANENGKRYLFLDFDGNVNHRFWVIEDNCYLV